MSDMNLDIIQNKLDALVEKIIQKENSDEEFRITYAQILEKINTKIDVFSGTENIEKLAFISMEIRDAINKRQEIVDGKFASIKSEFDRVNDILIDSFQSKDIVSAYERVEDMLKKQQEESLKNHNDLLDCLDSLNLLEETNESLKSNFAIIKEQNTISSENFAKQIETLQAVSDLLEENNEKTMKNFEAVLYTLQEFADSLNDDFDGLKEFIGEKTNSAIEKIHETDSFIELLNNNLGTLIQVVGSLFEDEEFADLQSDVTDVLTKISFITESLKKFAEKDDIKDLLKELETVVTDNVGDSISAVVAAKTEVINTVNNVVSESQSTILKSVNTVVSEAQSEVVSAVSDAIDESKSEIISAVSGAEENIKSVVATVISDTEEEVKNTVASAIVDMSNNIKDEVIDAVSSEGVALSEQIKAVDTALSESLNSLNTAIDSVSQNVSTKIDEFGAEITDVISTESIAASEQIKSVAEAVNEFKSAIEDIKESISKKADSDETLSSIEELKTELPDAVVNKQTEQINNALSDLHSKFVGQLIQIADNINFEDEVFEISGAIQDCTEELKDKISTDIADIKQEISQIKEVSGSTEENIVNMLEKVENAVNVELNNDIKALSNGFKILTGGLKEEKDYVYTLPDIESDLTKIRLNLSKIQNSILQSDAETVEAGADIASKINSIKESLEKLQNSTQDADIADIKGLFTSLNEDVSSISKRTNKLILSSDEVSKTLNNNIKSFTSVMKSFEKQSHDFYSSPVFKELNNKINNIAQTGTSISQSNKILNEAFMYLAEWIDSASETFEGVTEDITTIKEKIQAASTDEEADKVARNLRSLDIRVEEQTSKIDELENKIDAIDEKLNRIISAQNDAKESKSILEYVASQISIANEKMVENEKLALKMASMDKQLKKIEKNIAIITEYIDEEADEFDDEDDE